MTDYMKLNEFFMDELPEDSPWEGNIRGLVEKLLAAGVTFQKWIPVSERLPEDDLPKGSKVKQIKVLTALKSDKGVRTVRSQKRYRCTWYSDFAPWTWKYSGSEITHWKPLPEPPKE